MAALRKKANAKKEVDLIAMVQSGPSGAYEALQLYRSRAIRLKAKNDYAEAIKSTVAGTVCLLENSYENAGAELAELFVEMLVETEQQVNDDNRAYILQIDAKFPSKSSHRVEFLKTCIKWTITCGTREHGDPELHTLLGECLWNNNDRNAAYHFAAGEAPVAYNNKIQETHAGADQQEARDRALTVGVVNFLAMENLRDANELFTQFQKSQKAKGFSTSSDLVTFCDYLLQTCRRDATPLFKTLVNTYASQLDFDDAVPTLLMGPVASKLFGIKPKVNPMMSMLQSMMS